MPGRSHVPGSRCPRQLWARGLGRAEEGPHPASFEVALHSEEQSTHFSQTQGRRSSQRVTCITQRHPLWDPIPRSLVLEPALIPQGRPGGSGCPHQDNVGHTGYTETMVCAAPLHRFSMALESGWVEGAGAPGTASPPSWPHTSQGHFPGTSWALMGNRCSGAGGPSPPPR